MELWIKVQNNKKLKQGFVKIDDLFIEKDEEDDKWCITQCCNTLGIYKTEKRALEIAAEIFEMLKGTKIIASINETGGTMNNVFPIITYEMPKE